MVSVNCNLKALFSLLEKDFEKLTSSKIHFLSSIYYIVDTVSFLAYHLHIIIILPFLISLCQLRVFSERQIKSVERAGHANHFQ